jgi:integrase
MWHFRSRIVAEPQFDITSGRWYIRYYAAKDVRKKQYLPKHDGWKKLDRKPKSIPPQVIAEARKYQEIDAAVRAGRDQAGGLEVSAFLAAYRESHALRTKPASQKVLRYATGRFLDYCGRAGVKTVDAVKQGTLPANPWLAVDMPGRNTSTGTPHWTKSQVAKLLEHLDGWARDLFLIGINCGFRCNALRNMRWGWVRWQEKGRRRGILVCPAEWSKNGKEYCVPLFPELHDALARRMAGVAQAGPADLVFPGDSGDGGIHPTTFHRRVDKACKKAGIEWEGHAWHSMRSTFAVRCLDMGANPRAVQQWLSHSSLDMTDKYLGWSGEADDDEVDRMESRRPKDPTGGDPPAPGNP